MPWIAGSALSLCDQRQQFGFAGRLRQRVLLRMEAAALGRLALRGDVGLARRIVADQHGREAGRYAAGGQRRRFLPRPWRSPRPRSPCRPEHKPWSFRSSFRTFRAIAARECPSCSNSFPTACDRGDLGEDGQHVQLAIEVQRLRLARRGADAIPEAADLPGRERRGDGGRGIGGEPVVEARGGRPRRPRSRPARRAPRRAWRRRADRDAAVRRRPRRSSAPTPSESGASRASASRTEPLARSAAAAIAAGSASLHGGPSDPTTSTISLSDSGSSFRRRQRERIVGSTCPGRCDTIRISERSRRLLDHLQERVGAVGVQVLGAVDEADAPAAEGRRHLEHLQRVAHVVDADLAEELLLVRLPHAPDEGEIRMRQRREMTRGGALRVDREVARGPHGRRAADRDGRTGSGRTATRASPCRPPPDRRSARRGRAAPRDRRRASPPRRPCGRSAAGRDADAARRGRRRFRADRRPRAASCGRPAAPAGSSRASTIAQMAASTSSSDFSASITAQRAGSAAAMSRKARRSTAVEVDPLGFEPVRAASARASGRPARAPSPAGMSRISVRSGRFRPTTTSSRRATNAGRQVARGALIGAGRIGEAVADHPGAAFERRQDRRVQMVDAGGGEQQRLAFRPERPGEAGQDDLAQRLGVRRAARLAGAHDVEAGALSRASRRRACTDLPAPSPPSRVMKRPLRRSIIRAYSTRIGRDETRTRRRSSSAIARPRHRGRSVVVAGVRRLHPLEGGLRQNASHGPRARRRNRAPSRRSRAAPDAAAAGPRSRVAGRVSPGRRRRPRSRCEARRGRTGAAAAAERRREAGAPPPRRRACARARAPAPRPRPGRFPAAAEAPRPARAAAGRRRGGAGGAGRRRRRRRGPNRTARRKSTAPARRLVVRDHHRLGETVDVGRRLPSVRSDASSVLSSEPSIGARPT